MTRHFRRYLLVAVTLFASLFAFQFIQSIRYCDRNEQSKLVTRPDGEPIPLYTDSTTVKRFGELSTQCAYVGDQIQCPDIRDSGEAMNRQSVLAIARMHAILDLICKRYSIDYWIFAGTLIGARRNGLFVPWDADSDIGMMLKDYQRLLRHIRTDLPDDLYFQDGSDNPLWKRVTDAKLRDRNSCYGYCLRNGCQFEDGLQIDIFVFHESESDPGFIENHFYKTKFKRDDIYPTETVLLEGLHLPAPKRKDEILKIMFGPDFMRAPNKDKHQCSASGFTAIPWYSCQYIKSLTKDKQVEILKSSMDHSSYWYSYY